MTISIKPTASGSTIEQNGSTILTVDGSGNLSTPNTFTSTGGIYLGGTSAANLLDDYEEGTWTPTVTNPNDDVTATYTWQEGYYRKIGSLVWCFGGFQLASYSSITTTLAAEIGGLPFVAEDILTSSSVDGGGYVSYWGNLTTAWSSISASALGGSTKIRMWGAKTEIASSPQFISSDLNASSNLRFTVIYLTSE